MVHVPVADTVRLEDFLSAVRRARDEGGIVLAPGCPELPEWPSTARGSRDRLLTLVESVGDCGAVPLAGLTDHEIRPWTWLPDSEFPCLLGCPDVLGRLLTEHWSAAAADRSMVRSRPVRGDFLEFAALWTEEGDTEAEPPQAVHARLSQPQEEDGRRAFHIGRILAHLHRQGVLHGAVRPDSFRIDTQRGVAVSADHDMRRLTHTPTVGQCSSDIASLLPSLTPPDWRAFRLGYRSTWPDGARVTDCLEYGDTTGWMHSMNRRDWPRSHPLLKRALAACPQDNTPLRLCLLTNLGQALSELGHHDQAVPEAEAAVALGEQVAPEMLPVLEILLAFALLRAERKEDAARTLAGLIAGPHTPAMRNLAVRALDAVYATDPGSTAIPPDPLPFLARHGTRLTVIQPSAPTPEPPLVG
ncbi:hypothetical protein [Streptomyces sp. NPDC008240]|uniref:hypothetical protein n=2 Tax=unclassified Streptomyces TaxID=2593676 RepID=UPI0036EB284C